MGADTYYDILGVPTDASADDVARAYRKLAKQVHPDAGGNSALFRAVDEAYKTLSDPAARRAYDILVSRGPGPGAGRSDRDDEARGRREAKAARREAKAARRERAEEVAAAAARRERAEGAAAAARAVARAQAQRVEAERMATVAAEAAAARANAERLAWKRAGVFERYPAGSLTVVGAAASVLTWAMPASVLGWLRQLHAGQPQTDETARYYIFAIALAVLVAGLTAALGWAKLGLRGRPKELPRYQLPDLDNLSGPQFEALMGELLNFIGYRVRTWAAPQGYTEDLVIEDGEHSVAVHTVRYSGPMGPSAVYKAAAARQAYGTCCAMVVSTSSFSSCAWQVAEREQLTLWDRDTVIQQLAQLSASRTAAVRTRYARPYGRKLLKAELRRGVPMMLKLVVAVPLVPLAVIAVVAGASGGSTTSKSSR